LDEKFEHLLEILDKEVKLYRALLDLLQIERQCMIDLSLDKLHECHNQKETIILDLKVLEESRSDIVNSLKNGQHPEVPTLSKIIEMAPSRYRKGLESCRSNLVSLINSIREINQINGILAERAINYTRNSLSFLNRLAHELPVYLPSGRMEQSVKAGKLICKKG